MPRILFSLFLYLYFASIGLATDSSSFALGLRGKIYCNGRPINSTVTLIELRQVREDVTIAEAVTSSFNKGSFRLRGLSDGDKNYMNLVLAVRTEGCSECGEKTACLGERETCISLRTRDIALTSHDYGIIEITAYKDYSRCFIRFIDRQYCN